ncbi:MAG TPA: hypothetical protein VFF04_05480 [Candidatus Babeliales bacterium]|nr:hypothetical protein [Candidatus Babeliales bacterium]
MNVRRLLAIGLILIGMSVQASEKKSCAASVNPGLVRRLATGVAMAFVYGVGAVSGTEVTGTNGSAVVVVTPSAHGVSLLTSQSNGVALGTCYQPIAKTAFGKYTLKNKGVFCHLPKTDKESSKLYLHGKVENIIDLEVEEFSLVECPCPQLGWECTNYSKTCGPVLKNGICIPPTLKNFKKDDFE